MKKPKTHQEYVWVIAYIDSKFVCKVDRDLERFLGIEARIPTVKVLRKNFKKKAHYDEKPLLFNYGFFYIPKLMVMNPEFMVKLKTYVSCITGWVKDPVKELEVGRRKEATKVATCTEEELLILFQEAEEESIYSDKEVENLKEGQEVVMRGYPFEGIMAKIIRINKRKREVEVEIKTFGFIKNVLVQYENLIYNIYKGGYQDNLSNHVSLDEMQEKNVRNKHTRKVAEYGNQEEGF